MEDDGNARGGDGQNSNILGHQCGGKRGKRKALLISKPEAANKNEQDE